MLYRRSGLIARSAGLLSVAAAGGAIALLGAWLFGGLGKGTTTVREDYAGPTTPVPSNVVQTGGAMTIGQIYKEAAPGVVQITANIVTQTRDLFGTPFGFPQEEKTLGSGFVLAKTGYIVTNYHVVNGAQSIRVSFSNNDSMEARVIGWDPSTDVAVLKVHAKSRALKPLTLGNSDLVRVGDAVVALGNPFGYFRTVTAGIVSALQRRIQSPNSQTIGHIIQTDAAINPGNSGIGFAIPVNTVKDVAAQLISTGKVEHPFLGIEVKGVTPQFVKLFGLPVQHGLLVESVYPHTGAAEVGLKAGTLDVVVLGESYRVGGDVIVSVDGIPVSSGARLQDIINSKKPGDTVTLEIYRGKIKQSLDVKL